MRKAGVLGGQGAKSWRRGKVDRVTRSRASRPLATHHVELPGMRQGNASCAGMQTINLNRQERGPERPAAGYRDARDGAGNAVGSKAGQRAELAVPKRGSGPPSRKARRPPHKPRQHRHESIGCGEGACRHRIRPHVLHQNPYASRLQGSRNAGREVGRRSVA
jgi:hypothetical protein